MLNEFSTVMISPGAAFKECTGSCHENVPAPKVVSSNLRSADGLTVLARIEIVTILVHYQASYNTTHTMKPSDPLLLADVTLRLLNANCTQYQNFNKKAPLIKDFGLQKVGLKYTSRGL